METDVILERFRRSIENMPDEELKAAPLTAFSSH